MAKNKDIVKTAKISVIIPMYITNRAEVKMTKRCIKSFERTLKGGDELIVIDDCSPYRHDIVNIRQPQHKGKTCALNYGVKFAVNDVLVFSDNNIEANIWREPMLRCLKKNAIVVPTMWNKKTKQKEKHLTGGFWMITKKNFNKIGGIEGRIDCFMQNVQNNENLEVAENTKVIHERKSTLNESDFMV